MLRLRSVALSIFILFLIGFSTAYATPYFAFTNQIGYTGTVSYVAPGDTATTTVSTSSPRNGYIYIVDGLGSGEYNIFLSNWFEHPPSNVNDSFFQLYDELFILSGQSCFLEEI